MKTRFRNVTARLKKEFLNTNTVINQNNSYSVEDIRPGPMVRNDPKFHKTPATWSYKVIYRVATNDYEAKEPGHQVYDALGPKRYQASGCFGKHIPDPTPVDLDCSVVKNIALNRLNDDVRGSLDLSIALAEAGKTATMVRNAARVLTFAKQHKPKGGYPRLPGPLRHFSDATAALANGYLEFKYGWKPLLSDVFGVADESIRLTLNQLQKFKATAKYKEDRQSKFLIDIDGVQDIPFIVEGECEYKAKYQVSLMLPPSSFDIARWTSLNPVSIGWELIPYSFVVDWFVDVGSYLRNLETALYYNTMFRYGFVSTLSIHTLEAKLAQGSIERTSAFDGSKDKFTGLEAQERYIDFNRTVLSTYPFPSLPSFTANLGASQLTSAAALLRQLLRRV